MSRNHLREMLRFLLLSGVVIFPEIHSKGYEAQDEKDVIDAYADHTGTIKFFRCHLEDWDTKSAAFSWVIANLTNMFCSEDISACCLTTWHNTVEFHSRFVRILPSYPKEERFTFLIVKFVVLYNVASYLGSDLLMSTKQCKDVLSITPKALSGATIQDIIERNVEAIEQVVGWRVMIAQKKDETQKWMDIALLPAGVALIFVFLVIVKTFEMWSRHVRESKEHSHLHEKNRKNSIKINPAAFKQRRSLAGPALAVDIVRGSFIIPPESPIKSTPSGSLAMLHGDPMPEFSPNRTPLRQAVAAKLLMTKSISTRTAAIEAISDRGDIYRLNADGVVIGKEQISSSYQSCIEIRQ